MCDDSRMDDAAEASLERAAALATEIRTVTARLKRRLSEQADPSDLTASQIAVLLRLNKTGPATASGLARAEAMKPQSMATIIAALDRAGLVTGAPDPADGRQTLLSLSDLGRDRVGARCVARQDWLSRAIQTRLSAGEQAALAASLALFARLAHEDWLGDDVSGGA